MHIMNYHYHQLTFYCTLNANGDESVSKTNRFYADSLYTFMVDIVMFCVSYCEDLCDWCRHARLFVTKGSPHSYKRIINILSTYFETSLFG